MRAGARQRALDTSISQYARMFQDQGIACLGQLLLRAARAAGRQSSETQFARQRSPRTADRLAEPSREPIRAATPPSGNSCNAAT